MRSQVGFRWKWTLGSSYLIEFQHPGCVSRQLMFDTRVPNGIIFEEDPVFETILNLEMPSEGQQFEFLALWATCITKRLRHHFRFHRDYKMFGEQTMLDRMTQARIDFPAVDVPVVLANVGYTTHPGYEYGDLVLTTESVAPKVHLTGAQKLDDRPQIIDEKKGPIHDQVLEKVEVVFVKERQPEPEIDHPRKEIELPVLAVLDPGTAKCESREVITKSHLRIIKDLFIVDEGQERQYRKVVHRYGDVHFFCNGSSCSKSMYVIATTAACGEQ